MPQIFQPHDRLFKALMHELPIAIDFFNENLPHTVKDKIDLSSLQVISETQINARLQMGVCDIVFSVQLKTDERSEKAYLVLLHAEHQSTQDPMMAWRILQYQTGMIDMHLRANPGVKKLPPVISFVYYTGSPPYRAERDVVKLFSNEELARENLGQYCLVDLHRMPEGQVKEQAKATLLHIPYLKARANLQVFTLVVSPFLRRFHDMAGGVRCFSAIIEYVLEVHDGDPEAAEKLAELLSAELPYLKEITMSIASRLEQRGRAEGLIKGREEGREEGREKERAFVLQRCLEEGLPIALIAKMLGCSEDEVKSLQEKIKAERNERG